MFYWTIHLSKVVSELLCLPQSLRLLIQALEFLMIYVCRCLFYSVRNLIFYRDVRNDPAAVRRLLQRLEASEEKDSEDASGLQTPRDVLTEFVLSSLGLAPVNDSNDRIPRGVWLTAAQRDCIAKVSEFGYQAGLR
jgi:hypothetical protein